MRSESHFSPVHHRPHAPLWLAVAVLLPFFALVPPAGGQAAGQTPGEAGPEATRVQLIDDFEAHTPGTVPGGWTYLHEKKMVPLTEEFMRPRERFTVVEDGSRQVLRAYSHDEAVHISLVNGEGRLDWDMETHPVMAWEWNARKLPPGAREDQDQLNDSAAAIYVIFSMEGFIVKRPKTIKYVFSSTLPAGTVISYGKLKVIVVSDGTMADAGWIQVERDVAEDYRMVYGEDPPRRPLSIRLWSDSDNTGSEAEVDFDNIRLISGSR